MKKIKENFWEFGLIVVAHMAEYTKPKTEQCTEADAQYVYVRFKLESEEKEQTGDFFAGGKFLKRISI